MYQSAETQVPLCTEKETAGELHVKPGTLRNWRCKGIGLSYVKLGRHIFYTPEEIRRYIKSRTIHPEQEG